MSQVTDTEKFSPLLVQLLEQLQQFKTLLDREAQALKENDISPLNDILTQKETLSGEIDSTFQTMSQHLPMSELSLGEFIQVDAFKSLPSSVQSQFLDALQLANDCQQQNTANGMTVQTLSNFNQKLLQIFKGQDPDTKTYGSTGHTTPSDAKSSTLGKA